MSTYNFPKNTDSTLYINLEYERIKVTGCGCCYDSTDWTEYLRVEKVKDGDQSTGIQQYSLGHMIAPAQI